VLQGALPDDIIHFSNQEANDTLKEFISDPLPATLFSFKLESSWVISFSLDDVKDPVSTIVIIKDNGVINEETPLETQLQIVNLPSVGSSFETLRSLISLGVGTYFDVITTYNKTDFVTSTRKKINELALSLRNLEQSIETPDLLIMLHPALKKAITKGANLENYTEFMTADILLDPSFLNSLQNTVNNWVKSIQDVTKMERDVPRDSAFEEINFWTSMEISLLSIKEQIDSTDVQLTLEVLKYAKRYHATVSFLSDTGIQDALIVAADYNKLMKDFPLNELLAAESLDKIEEAIILIMNHLKRIRLTSYPISRALPFVEAISTDLENKIRPMLKDVMSLDYEGFEEQNSIINSLFETFDKQIKEFTNIARELLRKRGEKFIFVKINSKTNTLKDRLSEILSFRRGHQDFVNTLKDSPLLEKDLNFAYDAVRTADVFESEKNWSSSRILYEKRIEQIENDIVDDLRSSLDLASNSNELFEIFENHKNLIERPRIKAAIQEYQSHLLGIVKTEIDHLQNNFASKTGIKRLSELRDYPESSHILLWGKQIEKKLQFLMNRLELVFGKDWNSYSEGQRIYQEYLVFQKKLDLSSRFEEWVESVRGYSLSGDVLKLVKDKDITLQLNFDESLMKFFKEVRTLSWQGFQIPHQVILNSRKVRKVYMHSIVLQESLFTLSQLSETLESLDDLDILLVDVRQELYDSISAALEINWEDLIRAYDLQNIDVKVEEHEKLATVIKIEDLISILSKKVNELSVYHDEIKAAFNELGNVDFSNKSISLVIERLQTVVNQISKSSFTQVVPFVEKLNIRLAKKLLQVFCNLKLGSENYTHEIVVADDLTVNPPFEHTKALLYSELQNNVDIISQQRRLVERSLDSGDEESYIDFSGHMEAILDKFQSTVDTVETDFTKSSDFVAKWQQSRALWGLDSDEIYHQLTIESWLELFAEVKKSKEIFGTAQAVSVFGKFSIDFQEAKEVIYSKFSSWHRDLLLKFSQFLSDAVKSLHISITKGRKSLESIELSLTSVTETVELISNLQTQRKLLAEVKQSLILFRAGEMILFKNKFKFTEDHIFVDQVDNDYDGLNEIIFLRSRSIDDHLDVITKNIETESHRIENLVTELHGEWSKSKPVNNSSPTEAISILKGFQTKVSIAEKRRKLLNEAASLLVLPIVVSSDLTLILEELNDLKSVWSSVQGLWDSLEDLKKTEWSSLKTRQLRKQLDELLQHTRSMPVRIRQHQPYQKFLKLIVDLSDSQKIILTLKEEFIKERHLKLLFTQLNKKMPSDLSVGHIWELNLFLHEPIVNKIISQAESERVIEDSLTSIHKNWEDQRFELFEFHNQRLVKNFQQLIELSSTDLSSLTSMKNSASFKTFEVDIDQWSTKLYTLHNLFDNWVEVQRQWMDLDGVFDPKSGINRLLTTEAARFQGISVEFISVTKRIFKNPVVIEATAISDLGPIMHRLSESLNKISKALGDFLEKQRELYPRFYFIGNDDLLSMLGSDDIQSISKHFKKMFPGVFSVHFDKQTHSITAIASESDEVVVLLHPVELKKYERIDEWISQLDYQIKVTLADLVKKCLKVFKSKSLVDLLALYPLQVVLLSLQILWTKSTEDSIREGNFEPQLAEIDENLKYLSSNNQTHDKRYESLIIEYYHQKDVLLELVQSKIKSATAFHWNCQQRFYYVENDQDSLQSVTVKQLTMSFVYGFEYLGLMERLVYTPLLNNCFMSMSGALEQGLGGSPFGPAGTGKTESIKAMGSLLGKMVVVFNCDESFDFQAVGRLLSGICQVGGWGCFDEFNRLDKNILSAVSSQLAQIELGLKEKSKNIELLDKRIPLVEGTGVFVTMNPGYSGRSELPENLKKLFRSFSMVKADSMLISKVLLAAGGFLQANEISQKVVDFFDQLKVSVSNQKHYDFGLRSLKSTLGNAATILKENYSEHIDEVAVIVKSLKEMILPRLTSVDSNAFFNLKDEIFPNVQEIDSSRDFRDRLKAIAEKRGLIASDDWLNKATQLSKIEETQQGVIIAGVSGSGKTTIISTVIEALGQHEINIDPKVLKKHELFGQFYPSTRQWNDGLFTSIIRKINEDLRGDLKKKYCIVFDGDIDPIWIESLNSVLDDNKTLTLPNGERLKVPANVRFVFETDSLRNATPATISRCGMIITESAILSTSDLVHQKLRSLEDHFNFKSSESSESQIIADKLIETLRDLLDGSLLEKVLQFSLNGMKHISKVTRMSLITSFFIFVQSALDKFISQSGSSEKLPDYSKNSLYWALFYGFAGSAKTSERQRFISFMREIVGDYPDNFDFYVDLEGQQTQYYPLPALLESHAVNNPNTVIETNDTMRHEDIIHSVLSQENSLILCGPPGAGKTMSLYAVLQKSPEIDLVNMNFSKETEPFTVLRALEQCCEYKRTAEGFVLRPKTVGKRVVLFADEVNLPKPDGYGTQVVISFLRQLIEKKGFWRFSDKQWISLQGIQFVGACNPSADAGRYDLSERFLSHIPIIMVDYPGMTSLFQIYDSFVSSILKLVPHLKGFSKEITNSMLDIYEKSLETFTTSTQPHYIYTPRELTRWVRGLHSALTSNIEESIDLDDFIRLFVHEAIRLFSDRLVTEEEKGLSFTIISETVKNNFPNMDIEKVLKLPMLYSNWLSLNYKDVSLESITQFIENKFDVFTQEMLEVDFVFYDSLIQEILNIDRVLKQSGGHVMLIGPSGSGKRTMTKFVAWMNGLKVNQLNMNRNYTIQDFDQTLKDILKSCGLDGDKLVFLLDTSNIQQPAFFERINSLLANGQINDLFEPDEYQMILKAMRDQCQLNNILVDSDEEVENILISNISQNLHVVFTMTGIENSDGPQIITSPALFNRCVINWVGEMTEKTMLQIAKKKLELSPVGARDIVVKSLIFIHQSNQEKQPPAKFFQLIGNFIALSEKKQIELDESQRRTNNGVVKLKETVLTVSQQRKELGEKQSCLQEKEKEAHKMLNRILDDQNLSERKKEASIAIKETLSRQDVLIEKRRQEVMRDLELAEPAVLEARAGVQNIKKQHLTELRSMSSPPATIQLILESVCVLLGYNVQTWRDVQSVIRKDDFIYNIVNFDCEQQVTHEVREYMDTNYLSRPEYNQDAAYRASQACGPLLQWVEAQVRYSLVLGKVGPLQDEIEQLEQESQQTRARLSAADDMIEELEDNIQNYKDGYTEMIRETENIKGEIKEVEIRTERSMTIVRNLESEKKRWISNIKSFKEQTQNLIPQCLLSASVFTYSGRLDHKLRIEQYNLWSSFLKGNGIEFEEIRVTEHLNTSSNLLQWENCGLPNDELFYENVTILEKVQFPKVRYLIDGVGNLLETISKKLDRKISLTSFLNKNFIHDLQNALRFGGVLVIQDAENFDPILAPLLSNEFQRVGNRKLIRIGDKDVDCSADFELLLYTTDRAVTIPEFVRAATSVIDFTISETSLEIKSLDMIIRSERPEVYKKKLEYIKLSSEYRFELGRLEDNLLESLNTDANLLDNLELVKNLEGIKRKATDVNEKIQETAGVMDEISEIVAEYQPFAKSASTLFSLLSKLDQLHQFYQFSLSDYVSWIQAVLDTEEKKKTTSRVFFLLEELHKEVYINASVSLSVKDNKILLVALCVLLSSERENDSFSKFMLKLLEAEVETSDGKCVVIRDAFKELTIVLDDDIIKSSLIKHDANLLFDELRSKNIDLSLLSPILNSVFNVDQSKAVDDLWTCLLESLKSSKLLNLQAITESIKTRPIILTSNSSFDPSYKVSELARSVEKELKVVALGSSESVKMANREISKAAKQGGWIMIQNIHTSPKWLESFEKTFSTFRSHDSFRLFLTCDSRSEIPITILRDSKVLMFENYPGIKSVFKENFKPSNSVWPVEKKHVYYLITWFHSIVQERNRYIPKGFTKSYDFNDSDFQSAIHFIDRSFDTIYKGKDHISPDDIDWLSISYVVSEIIYGGKVDVADDSSYLQKLAKHIFSSKSFEIDFNLVEGGFDDVAVTPPEGRDTEDYLKWIEELPNLQPISWLGLNNDSESEVKREELKEAITKSKKLMSQLLANPLA
jgi:dynein heavy chain 1